MSDNAELAFLSVVRRGLAALVRPGPPLAGARVGVPVSFSVGGTAVSGVPTVALRGPGDVVGFDASAICRTWPTAGAAAAEPNYFALAELSAADLPWRYTPDATAGDRLAPWLCLIVVEDGEVAGQVPSGPGRPLAVVTVTDASVLPDPSQSWAWAHGQVVGSPDPAADYDPAAVGSLLEQAPSRLRARLLCPRRLHPQTSYHAFVVPAYERGRLAGLGLPLGGADRLAPAWATGQQPVTLPVYASWTFQTGEEGDFASLAARLQPVGVVPPEVWQRQLAVSPPGADPPAWQVADLEGALIPHGAPVADWAGIDAHGFTSALEARVNAQGPRLEPPLYGRWLAAQSSLSTAPAATPPWFHELNGDPRARVGAGLGTVLVQDEQQQLLAGAWAQVEGIRAANETLRLAQLARELALRLYARHVSALDPPGLLEVSGPLHARVRAGPSTILAQVAASPVAAGVFAPAWRRVKRPLGTLAVRQARPWPSAAADAVARMNGGELSLVPPRPAPPASVTGAAVRLGDLGTAFASLHVAPEKLGTVTPPAGFALRYLPAIAPGVVAPGTPVPPPAGKGSPAALGFGQAAVALMTQLALPTEAGITLTRADLEAANTAITSTLDPLATIEAPIVQRLSGVLSGPRRTDPLEPVMAAPDFPQPTYQPLTGLDRAWLLPGLDAMQPPDAVALFMTNWRFVESFLVGLNHEMARKLLWNGYPTDQRGTYFRHFWDIRGNVDGAAQPDAGPIHLWNAALGKNRPTSVDPLVLLVRGELIRRYPNVIVSAVQAVPAAPGTTQRGLGTVEKQPLFFGRVDPDVALFGFDLDPTEASGDPGWFFVLAEHPSEPRFGLAAPPADDPVFGGAPATWQTLGWDHLAASAEELATLRFVDLTATLPDDAATTDEDAATAGAKVAWHANATPGSRAAHIAHITFRRPTRLAIHGSILLPGGGA